MADCVFCKIIKKEIPADTVYENEKFLVFLDINPINKGHALLIPKEHYQNLYDLPDDTLKSMAPLIKKTALAIKKAVKADGVNIGMNNEGAAGQIVAHAHIHVIPRLSKDGLRHWRGNPYANKKEAQETAEKIKKEF